MKPLPVSFECTMLSYTDAVAVPDTSELSVECDGSCDITETSDAAVIDADINSAVLDVLWCKELVSIAVIIMIIYSEFMIMR